VETASENQSAFQIPKEPSMTLPILAITSGEPAGIGPDICLDLAQARLPCRCVVLGDKDLLRRRAALLGKQITLRDFNPHRPSDNISFRPHLFSYTTGV